MIKRRTTQGIVALTAALLTGAVLAEQAAPVAGGTAKPAAAPAGKAAAAAPVAAAKASAAPVAFQSRRDKLSYAFGADLARDLKRQPTEINPDMVIRALTDSFAGRKLAMTDEEVSKTLSQFAAEQKQDFEHARMMLADKNRKAAEAFVAENVKKSGVVTLPDGLQYKILKKGSGKTPAIEDYVVVNYRGTLLDGTEISNSAKSKEPKTPLPLKMMIPGLVQALQLMPAGSKWQIYLPPSLAYGDKVVAGFGPNAMLIFDVELVSIQDKAKVAGQPQTPGTGGASDKSRVAANHKP